jgi:hypothetical protein
MFGCDWKMDYAPEGLHEAPWLAVGMAETNGFPVVQQWIDLMAMLAVLLPPQQALPSQLEQAAVAVTPEEPAVASAGQSMKTDGGRKRKPDENEEDERPTKRTETSTVTTTAVKLRKRKDLTYTTCRGPKCGQCMACRAV